MNEKDRRLEEKERVNEGERKQSAGEGVSGTVSVGERGQNE